MKKTLSGTRGQSSVEFMMTYGWTILIIAVALIVLWQWGIFNPSGNVRETYLGFWGVMPIDTQYRANGDLTISFKNNIIDGDINITEINVSYGDDMYSTSLVQGDPATPIEILSGMTETWNISQENSNLPTGTPGGGYTLLVIVTYNDNRVNDTNFTSSGAIQGNMES